MLLWSSALMRRQRQKYSDTCSENIVETCRVTVVFVIRMSDNSKCCYLRYHINIPPATKHYKCELVIRQSGCYDTFSYPSSIVTTRDYCTLTPKPITLGRILLHLSFFTGHTTNTSVTAIHYWTYHKQR